MAEGTRSRHALGGAVALGLLLGAVGLASRAHTPSGGGPTRTLSGDVLLEYALLLVAALAVVAIPVSLYALVLGRDDETDRPPSRRNWMRSLLVTMAGLSVVAFLLLWSGHFRRHDGGAARPASPLADLAKQRVSAPRAVRFDWVPVIVVSSLGAAGLAAGLVLAARRRSGAVAADIRDALALALDEVLDDLRADLDPRTTVIAAYAQMERVLARHGLPRAASEAPREYLLRVLPGVGAGAESAERLTTLYEHARFSDHEIDGNMKDEAIEALTSVRNELRGSG